MLAALKRQWSMYDLQYVFIALVFFVDFSIIQLPTLIPRFILAGLLITSFFIPYIKRFTVPALPIFTWLTTFYACQFIPLDYRPDHIFVNLLPTLERILYGANLSEIISQHTHPVLDVLAWLPYGVIHFSFPFILSLLLFVYGPPGCLKIFGKAFGFMNLAGVLTQLLFPNASPWYEIIYGSAPADYSIPGEAGGLLRIDEILGLDLYGSTFGTSPLVFGAFPSLHSGCATIEMLFFAYLFPRMKPVAIFYVMWMWFSTMYLTHHYMIDLVGGSIYAILAFAVAQNFLPKVNPDYHTRMDYLGVSKLSIRSFLYSIEHDPRDYYKLPMTSDEEEKNVVRAIRPEPLRVATAELFTTYKTEEEVVALPALSPGYWSSTSEPTSPITPHTPSSGSPRLQFNKP
ncbi:Aureobasidin resistance protein Aur1 [Rhizopus stolonifer]|uniref:Aureobasidin resistance protein Aur1 n=1 Tax=Rhizopus stolonifer TaxID=4846 RepID=A0A367JGR3_RHIST|nr:Aureobasidin resistance protein Aur1 [Rhizopus stolonifer]